MDARSLNRILIIVTLSLAALAFSCQSQDSAANRTRRPQERPSIYQRHLDEEIPTAELEQAQEVAASAEKLALKDYAYTWTDSDQIPDVVIIVDDFGNSGALLEDFAQLPSEVVFAVLPDLSHTRQAGQIAAQYGHEVLIHVPMQALSASANPGDRYIKTTSTEDEISALLDEFHTQLPMAIGANNHMGSAVTANRDAMSFILRQLHAQGLFFADSFTTGETVGPALARTMGYPALRRDIFLDVPDNSDATLAGKISSLGKYKGRSEPVIIITHCHSRDKLKALQKFITQVQGMGVRLTTLSRASAISA
ncbi:MAG: divergent polysaccharide deacetylase family protein [Candidatus Syntrophosphaera sp.]|nr:divergent polysaccharide deacetylase family protein [Candidatus Syntrophosphaera sp.]